MTADDQVLAEVARILDTEADAHHVVIDLHHPELAEALSRALVNVQHCDGTMTPVSDEQWARAWPLLRDNPGHLAMLGRLTAALRRHGQPAVREHGPATIDGRGRSRHVGGWETT